MWQWTDGTCELYHYGVKGMKWGVRRENWYGTSKSKFKASNGVTVGAPKNASVAAFRKVQGSRVGSAALNGIARTNTLLYGHGKAKKLYSNMEKRIRMENQAVRESEQAHKAAQKLQKKTEISKNIKDYRKKFDSASAQSDHADALWKDAKAKYNALGRNRVERVLATIQNKSAAAKEYNTAFNKANSASDRADAAWAKSKEAYAKTGKNAVSRVINNIRYDTRR